VQWINAHRDYGAIHFKSIACSGAQITTGLLNPYDGIEPAGFLPAQTRQLPFNPANIDALLISIGANDLGFAKIVTRCALISRFFRCSKHRPGKLFRANEPELVERFADLDDRLAELGVPSDRVYLTEYMDPTGDDDGRVCGRILGHLIKRRDLGWARATVLPKLNGDVEAAADQYGWNYIGGIAQAFADHGYCANDHWIVRFGESRKLQGDRTGTLHPNGAGQACYGKAIRNRLLEDVWGEARRSLDC
jgi:hypothetical protein